MTRTQSQSNFQRLLSTLLLLSFIATAVAPLLSFPSAAYADFPQKAKAGDTASTTP